MQIEKSFLCPVQAMRWLRSQGWKPIERWKWQRGSQKGTLAWNGWHLNFYA
jgi:hypothetical protein